MDNQFGFINDKIDIAQLIRSTNSPSFLRDVLFGVTSVTRMKHGLSSTLEQDIYYGSDTKSDAQIIMDWLQSSDYVTFVVTGSKVAWRYNTSGYIDAIVLLNVQSKDSIRVTVYGDDLEVRGITAWMKTKFETGGSSTHTVYRLDRNGNPVENISRITKNNAQLAKDSFYPWMNVSIEDYFKAFMASDESVLLLYGPPGSGKSTFIRSLINSNEYSAMMAYGHDVIISPAILDKFHERDLDILCYEDIDNYLGNREKEENHLMPILLNASEGVMKKKGKKIILSTNLPSIDRIDPALLRIGRCFDIIQFRELTTPEASAVLVDMGMPAKDFSKRSSWLLADVLAGETVGRQTINRFAKPKGFGI